MTDPRAPIFAAVRAAKPDVFNHPEDGSRRIGALDNVLDALGIPRAGQHIPDAGKKVTPSPKASEPRWMQLAREKIGEREIKGPKHNNWIAGAWGRLGATWFNDDETPWCGLFVADCLERAGRKILGAAEFPRALAWAKWGVPCPPTVGAVVVFKRTGGGHVGFLVGESEANYYVLGGNQGDMVSIAPIAKARAVAIRWPHDVGRPAPGLPRMTGGVVSTNEA
ncbi:TIGR02594 family protein [Porphyrobacter sp. YT40]|uniref:TIGR02594 family protein n=1 Tax=Porphyrobacter sp. YT40 TaxID=2547601 RepID=UPI0015E8C704|nr:TIGR02594 family protein [Porphyrobacter sp. YT40]